MIDEYKSKYPPRGSPSPGRRWQIKGGPYERRRFGLKGTVKEWHGKKNYGFILPDDGGGYVFIHISDLVEASALNEFDKVEFDVERTSRGLQAVNVKVIQRDE